MIVASTGTPEDASRSDKLSSETPRTISSNETVTGPTTPVGVAIVAIGATVSGEGMRIGAKSSPSNQSRSTQPVMPGTWPQLLYCQIVQPFPCQSFAGRVGAATPQWATHSTVYPASAIAVVSAMRSFHPFGLV